MSQIGGISFTIEDLSSESGVSTSTIRYYQSEGLLQPPTRDGRVGRYSTEHLERLRRIQRLKDRGFSLAAIRVVLAEHKAGGSLSRLLGNADTSAWEEGLASAIARAFPDEGTAAAPIKNAASLGMLVIEGDQVSVAEKSMEPMVRSILRLFELGLDAGEAMELWQTVIGSTSAISERFAELAHSQIYPNLPEQELATAAAQLVTAARQVVSLALDVSLEQAILADADSVMK